MSIFSVFKKDKKNTSMAEYTVDEINVMIGPPGSGKTEINCMQAIFTHRTSPMISGQYNELLQSRTEHELRELALYVLGHVLSFVRQVSMPEKPKTATLITFSEAVLWHITDAIHNIPSYIDEPSHLLDDLVDFFVTVEACIHLNCVLGLECGPMISELHTLKELIDKVEQVASRAEN